jgi:hypothetical protein
MDMEELVRKYMKNWDHQETETIKKLRPSRNWDHQKTETIKKLRPSSFQVPWNLMVSVYTYMEYVCIYVCNVWPCMYDHQVSKCLDGLILTSVWLTSIRRGMQKFEICCKEFSIWYWKIRWKLPLNDLYVSGFCFCNLQYAEVGERIMFITHLAQDRHQRLESLYVCVYICMCVNMMCVYVCVCVRVCRYDFIRESCFRCSSQYCHARNLSQSLQHSTCMTVHSLFCI